MWLDEYQSEFESRIEPLREGLRQAGHELTVEYLPVMQIKVTVNGQEVTKVYVDESNKDRARQPLRMMRRIANVIQWMNVGEMMPRAHLRQRQTYQEVRAAGRMPYRWQPYPQDLSWDELNEPAHWLEALAHPRLASRLNRAKDANDTAGLPIVIDQREPDPYQQRGYQAEGAPFPRVQQALVEDLPDY